MLIDCDSCAVRDLACGDCVVTVLLGMPLHPGFHSRSGDVRAAGEFRAAGGAPVAGEARLELDGAEQAAIAVLAGQGLVPPLRLVPSAPAAGGSTASKGGNGSGSNGSSTDGSESQVSGRPAAPRAEAG